MSSSRNPLALPAPDGGVVELTKIFESLGVLVNVVDAQNGNDDTALNDDGSEEVEQSPRNQLDIFTGRKCKIDEHSEDVRETGLMLLDSSTTSSIAEYLEQTDGKRVSSWGLFSFCIILWQKHLADKKNHKILDVMIRREETQRMLDMISRLPEEVREVAASKYVNDEIDDHKYRKRNQQFSNSAQTLLKIVCFYVLIYFIVKKLVPIGNTLFDTANVTAEAVLDAVEAAKKTTKTGKEGVFFLNDIVSLGTRIGRDVVAKAERDWAWYWNRDNTENDAIGKMFIVGSGQSEKERMCFLDFLTEIHEFIEEEIRSIFPHRWIPYVSHAKTQDGKRTYESTHVYFSSTGRANVAAETFLDALNAWNNLSDNSNLSDDECARLNCSATAPITVETRNEAFDRPEDLHMVRRMSNVSVAYGKSAAKTAKTRAMRHWDPPLSDSKIQGVVADITKDETKIDDAMRSAAWAKIREGYARLKEQTHDESKGWYYLLTLAMVLKGRGRNKVDQNLLRFYEAKDPEGNVAVVPVLRHSPELTVQYTNKNGGKEDIKEMSQLEELPNEPKYSSYARTNAIGHGYDSANLKIESFKADVLSMKL